VLGAIGSAADPVLPERANSRKLTSASCTADRMAAPIAPVKARE
jgi:hypothetical protein